MGEKEGVVGWGGEGGQREREGGQHGRHVRNPTVLILQVL